MAFNGFMEFFHKGKVDELVIFRKKFPFLIITSLPVSRKTFRPKKRFTQGTIRYSLHKQAQASLQSGINLRQVVRLPPGENMNDWLAVHGELLPSIRRLSIRILLCGLFQWWTFLIAST